MDNSKKRQGHDDPAIRPFAKIKDLTPFFHEKEFFARRGVFSLDSLSNG
jgi:hypothetical protein